MLRKAMLFVMAAVAASVFVACSSVQTGSVLNNQKLTTDANYESMGHVHAKIWGIYLLSLPVFTGSSNSSGRCTMFNDTVTVNNAVDLATKVARTKLNGSVVTDMTSETTSVWLIPTALFWYESVEVSGNVLK